MSLNFELYLELAIAMITQTSLQNRTRVQNYETRVKLKISSWRTNTTTRCFFFMLEAFKWKVMSQKVNQNTKYER